MQRNPDDTTRAVLALSIWVTFIGSLLTIVLHGIPKGNEALTLQLMTTLGSGVALVTNYYFKRTR